MKTLRDILMLSTDYLLRKGISSPRLQAEEILCELLGVKRMALYMDFDRPFTDDEVGQCREWLRRRGLGEPLQYIVGQQSFYGCDLKITPAVLIPRPETELLVEKVVHAIRKRAGSDHVVWDLCCGSGAIGIAIKKALPQVEVVLADICSDALALAQENATLNGVEVSCVQGDFLAPFKGEKADFIVSNPPYISESEYLELSAEVREYEPKKALLAPDEGLHFYKMLAADLDAYLRSEGELWVEIGHQQGEQVVQLFNGKSCHLEKDYAGHDRFVSVSS